VADTPRTWNWLGLVPVSAGVTIRIWVIILGFAHAAEVPEHVELNWKPKVLLTGGPYRFSRHPIYLAELALWFGWVLFYGNLFVLAGFVVVMSVVTLLVPREEQALERQFGDSYRRYKAAVHRWVGLPPR